MSRFPVIVTFGAALLGYLAGAMIVSDVAVAPWTSINLPCLELTIPHSSVNLSVPGLFGGAVVIAIGAWLTKRRQRRES
jgi:predicted tellurium resistance membrane protein TerC